MKKPVCLLVNDLHIDKGCIGDFVLNWDEMLEQCRANSVSHVLIGGDIFTSRSSQTLDVLMAVKSCIEKAECFDIKLVIALGNHDMVDQEATYGYPSLYDVYPHVTIVNDQPCFFKLSNDDGAIRVAIMRYWNEETMFENRFKELLAIMEKRGIEAKNTILYLHEGIHGGLGDFEAKLEVPSEIFKDFKSVLVGHYHNRIKIKNTNIEYIGSSRQNNFGEDEKKGYTLMFEDGFYSFIENQENTRYITFEKDFEELTDDFLGEIEEYRQDDYKIRLKVSCTGPQAKTIDRQKLFEAGVSKLEVNTAEDVAEKVTDEDLGKKFDKGGVCDEYESFCNSKNYNSELGMKYLKNL